MSGVTRLAAVVAAALVENGVRQVIVSPGARSAALALAVAARAELSITVIIDERSAGFFGLGAALATGRPVALLCTSGTAAANYLPAVLEASLSRVPLIVLTADRPAWLRDCGAAQTIEQRGLYGGAVREALELEVPADGQLVDRIARKSVQRVLEASLRAPAGPVHLNIPLPEPDASLRTHPEVAMVPTSPRPGDRQVAPEIVEETLRFLAGGRGLISAGPDRPDPVLARAIVELGARLAMPVLADVASGLRFQPHPPDTEPLGRYEAFLKAERFCRLNAPERMLRLGAPPTSRVLGRFLDAPASGEQLHVDAAPWRDPARRADRTLSVSPRALVLALLERLEPVLGARTDWVAGYRRAEQLCQRELDRVLDEPGPLTALHVARALPPLLAGQDPPHTLFAASSMAIRQLDLVAGPTQTPIRLLANRGANGIDGTVASALGSAATGPVTLLCGDVALCHDAGSLWAARQVAHPVDLVVLNDGGGTIFSSLPFAPAVDPVRMRQLFTTPPELLLDRLAAAYGVAYRRIETATQLEEAITAGRGPGVRLLDVQLDPDVDRRTRERYLERAALAVEASTP